MKCELCNYQSSPDQMPTLVQHLASACESPLAKEARIVWRSSELTATLQVNSTPVETKSKKSAKTASLTEIVFTDVAIPEYEAPPVPPPAVPIPPVETTVAEAKAK